MLGFCASCANCNSNNEKQLPWETHAFTLATKKTKRCALLAAETFNVSSTVCAPICIHLRTSKCADVRGIEVLCNFYFTPQIRKKMHNFCNIGNFVCLHCSVIMSESALPNYILIDLQEKLLLLKWKESLHDRLSLFMIRVMKKRKT